MRSKYYISNSERDVMERLWGKKTENKQSALFEFFQEAEKEWKR